MQENNKLEIEVRNKSNRLFYFFYKSPKNDHIRPILCESESHALVRKLSIEHEPNPLRRHIDRAIQILRGILSPEKMILQWN